VREPLPPVRHRRDGSTLLSLLLVLAGLAWLASTTGILDLSIEAVLAVALVVLGAGMVVTARTDWALSRRSWPVWLGIGLLVVLLGTSTDGSALGDRLSRLDFSSERGAPRTWADAATPVRSFAGSVSDDLTAVTTAPPDAVEQRVEVSSVFGSVNVALPAHPPYHIHVIGRSGVGRVVLPNGRSSGGGPHGPIAADLGPHAGPGVPTLILNAHSTTGSVTVTAPGAGA